MITVMPHQQVKEYLIFLKWHYELRCPDPDTKRFGNTGSGSGYDENTDPQPCLAVSSRSHECEVIKVLSRNLAGAGRRVYM